MFRPCSLSGLVTPYVNLNGVAVKFGLVSNPNFKVKCCVVLHRFRWSIKKLQFKVKI